MAAHSIWSHDYDATCSDSFVFKFRHLEYHMRNYTQRGENAPQNIAWFTTLYMSFYIYENNIFDNSIYYLIYYPKPWKHKSIW